MTIEYAVIIDSGIGIVGPVGNIIGQIVAHGSLFLNHIVAVFTRNGIRPQVFLQLRLFAAGCLNTVIVVISEVAFNHKARSNQCPQIPFGAKSALGCGAELF